MDKLPWEILNTIIDYASNRHDMNSLSQTCRMLNTVVSPKLYENVVISCDQGLPGAGILLPTAEGLARAKRIKDTLMVHELRIAKKAEVKFDDETHCYHNSNTKDTLKYFDGFEEFFLKFCRNLLDDCLRTFSWESRCCIPARIFGQNGYLTQHQRRLTKLSLITSGVCDSQAQENAVLDLSSFNQLVELSWIGPHSNHDFDALKASLAANAAHLENLNLDLLNWPRSELHTRRPRQAGVLNRRNVFLDQVLGWTSATPGTTLSALRNLSLSNFPFVWAELDLAKVLNFEQLRSLSLKNCQSLGQLLNHLVDNRISMSLVRLDITISPTGATYPNANIDQLENGMKRFLMSFHGLEDLFLCVPGALWESIAPGVQNHIGTMKRLVVHPTRLSDGRACVGEDADLDWFGWSILRLMWTSSDWDFFGSPSAPRDLRKALETSEKRPTWTVLHLRRSGCIMERQILLQKAKVEEAKLSSRNQPFNEDERFGTPELASEKARAVRLEIVEQRFEMLDFVIWAFGLEGLPNLQIIAYGDYSSQGRYAQFNSFFRRDEHELFCEVTKKAAGAWRLIEKHRDALESCATASILK